MRPASRLTLSLVTLLAACSSGGSPATGEGPRVDIDIAALNLEAVGDVVWDLEVANGDGDTVWQRRVTSSGYGDGAGSASYVGPCDAGLGVAENEVRLWVVGVYADAVSAPGVFARGDATGISATPVAFRNPTAVDVPLTQPVDCAPNADNAVRFDVTLLRPAEQGFFDVAVDFDDIYCSAKLDCCAEGDTPGCQPGEENLLLFDASGARAPTHVLALACTAGPSSDVETAIYLDALALDCTPPSAPTFSADIVLDPSLAPGNQCEAGALATCPVTLAGADIVDDYLYQVAVYRGVEQLTSGGQPARKIFWNVALGVKPATIGDCRLRVAATAGDAAREDDGVAGGTIAAGSVYPVIQWDVPLDASCGTEKLTFDDPGATVRPEYSATGDGARVFRYGYAPFSPPSPDLLPGLPAVMTISGPGDPLDYYEIGQDAAYSFSGDFTAELWYRKTAPGAVANVTLLHADRYDGVVPLAADGVTAGHRSVMAHGATTTGWHGYWATYIYGDGRIGMGQAGI
ncbi:MAG: hypothetical protein KC635_01565, partial [Myxococcales bacterium]|nr:hypothetical protein [Myxococcales bacterium]